jgi:hypothetical protein
MGEIDLRFLRVYRFLIIRIITSPIANIAIIAPMPNPKT